ncbi:MAG: hypothetical protein LHW45_04525, partial [Candidatus Cloacimonetes bacterium]|nr:hypothetical protein [Candidatus Cloacimonadota bacterium]MDY0366877.1 hypothetical protein [Candidatus Syntrophosphaera sp.]
SLPSAVIYANNPEIPVLSWLIFWILQCFVQIRSEKTAFVSSLQYQYGINTESIRISSVMIPY